CRRRTALSLAAQHNNWANRSAPPPAVNLCVPRFHRTEIMSPAACGRYAGGMSTPASATDSARWTEARSVAVALAATGVDPLDPAAARAARGLLVRRFVLDLLLIFGIVAVAAAGALMIYRAAVGDDPLGGREFWVASAALAWILAVVALRSILSRSAQAYEDAWAGFV